MVQGRQEEAIGLLLSCAKKGEWLILQNIHFVIEWLPSLEKELDKVLIDSSDTFCLWMITEEHAGFPSNLLQNSVKVALESPPGMKQNMIRTYNQWGKSSLLRDIDLQKSRLLFVLALFHAVVQERKSFLSQGWTKPYEFSDGDLQAGAFILCLEGMTCDWRRIHGLLSKTIYGSHIDDEFDYRILISYIEKYFTRDILSGKKEVSSGILVPNEAAIESHLKIISSLPDYDQPSTFGVPANVGRTQQRLAAESLAGHLRVLCDSDSNDKLLVSNADVSAASMKSLVTSWEAITKETHVLAGAASETERAQESDDAVVGFLWMERNVGRMLCKKVDEGFRTLKSVERRVDLSGQNSRSFMTALNHGEVPKEWMNVWSGPEKITDWLKGLVRRTCKLDDLQSRKG